MIELEQVIVRTGYRVPQKGGTWDEMGKFINTTTTPPLRAWKQEQGDKHPGELLVMAEDGTHYTIPRDGYHSERAAGKRSVEEWLRFYGNAPAAPPQAAKR